MTKYSITEIQWVQNVHTLVGNQRATVLPLCSFALPFRSAPTLI